MFFYRGRKQMKKWLVVGIILLFVGTCIIPAIAQSIEKPPLSTSMSIHKIFFLGTLINHSINETDFYLESHNLRVFTFDYYRVFGFLLLSGFSYYHYRAIIFSYGGMVDFHGILRPHFICGVLGWAIRIVNCRLTRRKSSAVNHCRTCNLGFKSLPLHKTINFIINHRSISRQSSNLNRYRSWYGVFI